MSEKIWKSISRNDRTIGATAGRPSSRACRNVGEQLKVLTRQLGGAKNRPRSEPNRTQNEHERCAGGIQNGIEIRDLEMLSAPVATCRPPPLHGEWRVYLKLVNQERIAATSRAHFFAIAATAMRHVLCNYARDRRMLTRCRRSTTRFAVSHSTISVRGAVTVWLRVNCLAKHSGMCPTECAPRNTPVLMRSFGVCSSWSLSSATMSCLASSPGDRIVTN